MYFHRLFCGLVVSMIHAFQFLFVYGRYFLIKTLVFSDYIFIYPHRTAKKHGLSYKSFLRVCGKIPITSNAKSIYFCNIIIFQS